MTLTFRIRRFIIPALAMAWIMLAAAPAPATTVLRVSFDRLVKEADLIIRGQCLEKSTQWVDGHLETTYKMKLEETLKGTHDGDTMDITLLGGRTDEPIKLNQFIPSQPVMFRGEKAVLFLSTKRVKLPPDPSGRVDRSGTRLHTTPRIMGLWQGKFTILEDAAGATEYVTRFTVEDIGYVPTDDTAEQFHQAMAREINGKKIPPTQEQLANHDWARDLASGGKAVKPQRVEAIQKSNPNNAPRTLGQVKAEEDIPFMTTYDDLKSRVTAVVKREEMIVERERARKAEQEMIERRDAESLAPKANSK